MRGGADTKRKDGKAQRHQIPGLQTSPYLRIYVLRCDDKDAYKATERGKIRQWIRDNSTSSSSKKKANENENHSASEYLILHVVVPDTVAASEPRWRESQREPDELKERKQGAKWPGKSTRTVFDKLRADFNDSSKTDRVAQLRLSKDSVPADLLPTPAQAVTYNETAEEQGKTWNDLLTKLKSLILIPFDKRVRQYEQDIAEQDSRRSLPGFNFCTFFIHKEGLARALEAIGLVEDALVIYDELSLGLESVLRDLASGQAEVTATTFATYTDDVKERIVGPGKVRVNGSMGDKGHNRDDSETIDSGEIDYRKRIVRSNISVFDFQCYLFTRRKALILRLANAVTARRQLGAHTKEGGEDLVLISEVCWRASNFLHNTARVLRQDLLAAKTAGKDDLSDADFDALVCSWLYTVAGQILDETAASALEPQQEHTRKESLKSPPNGAVTSPRRSEFSDLGSATAYPQRHSSLPARKSRVSELQNARASIHSASEETLVSPPSSSGTDGTKTASQLPGVPELVTYRAELVMMRRKMLEQLAAQRGWLAGWASLRAKRSKMETVDLNGSPDKSSEESDTGKAKEPSTLLPSALASSLLSEEIFHEAYDRLSDQAMRYYHSATQTKSAEAIVGDLAILKYQQGDWDFASKYFEHVLPTYRDEGWSMMEVEALQVLRVCWREMGRKKEEAEILLELVRKRVVAGREGVANLAEVEDEGYLDEVLALSEGLEKEIVVPASKYFGDVDLQRQILLFDDRDGFALKLGIRHYLDDDLDVDEVIARLVRVDDASQELCLMTPSASRLRRGYNELRLESSVTAFGPYLIDSVILKAKNIYFTHEVQATGTTEPTPLGIVEDKAPADDEKQEPHRRPWVFVYPAQQAFSAEIGLARDVHIDKPRHLEMQLSSGWNEISSLDLRLKPASAGLRLHLGDAQLDGLQRRQDEEPKPGVLALGPVEAGKSAVLTIPYSLDHSNIPFLAVHLSAQYRTTGLPAQPRTFLTSAKLPTELPLDVDVNDVFHDTALFSNFTIRATSGSPLVVCDAELRESRAYAVEAPPRGALGMMSVFGGFDGRLGYKITRREDGGKGKVGKKDAALALGVTYVVVQDLIAEGLRGRFELALEGSRFVAFRRLLGPLVGTRARQLLRSEDVEMAVLVGEADVPSYPDMGWEEIINTLPDAIRPGLRTWLKDWHANTATLPLKLDAPPQEQQRSITISVEVPTMDFVHRATLSILDPLHEVDGGAQQVLALGEPVTAELKISSTTQWSKGSVFSSGPSPESGTREERFIYEIHADPETWLIGGARRGHLSASEGSEARFTVTLIPLRVGRVGLPGVDVSPGAASRQEGDGWEGKEEVRCETHCASAGVVVSVVRDERGTRVVVPEGPGDGDAGGGGGRGAGHARGGSGDMGSGSRPATGRTVREGG